MTDPRMDHQPPARSRRYNALGWPAFLGAFLALALVAGVVWGIVEWGVVSDGVQPIAAYLAIGLAVGIAVWLEGRRLAPDHKFNAFILAITCAVAWPGVAALLVALLHPGLRQRIERYLEGRPWR